MRAPDTPDTAAAAPAPQATAPLRQYRFEFRGSTKEFYKIWLANMILSLLTLGIYSAWAKVRTRQYFYGNTFLDGAPFAYHAKPLPILISRLLVVAFIVAGVFVAGDNLPLAVSYAALFGLLAPLVIARGLAFNARYTSYRNIRFSFILNRAVYARLYLIFLPLIAMLFAEQMRLSGLPLVDFGAFNLNEQAKNTLELFFPWLLFLLFSPWVLRAYHQLKGNQYRWGEAKCGLQAHPVNIYLMLRVFLAVILVFLTCVYYWYQVAIIPGIKPTTAETMALSMTSLGFFAIFTMLNAGAFSLLCGALVLPGEGKIKFRNGYEESMRWATRKQYRKLRRKLLSRPARDTFFMAFISFNFINFMILVLSLGLLYPWTKIRKARFLAKHIALILPDDVLDTPATPSGALGDEMGDTGGFDFDVGLI